MKNLLRASAGLVVGLLTGGAALAAEITQPEGSTAITACVQVLDERTFNNTPVLASDCAARFGSYWHWGPNVISGIGTANGATTCLRARPDRSVVLSACNPSFPGSGEAWSYDQGEVIVHNGPLSGLCLDSRGFYGTAPFDQLVVNGCSGSPTQQWMIK